MRPSFIYHQIHVAFTVIAMIFIVIVLFKDYKTTDYSTIAILLLLVGIACGVHAIIHFFEEIYFDFNPMIGKSEVLDNPVYR